MSKTISKGQVLPFSVSQNFLTSASTIKRLLRLSSITKNDRVIEIGTGKGHITRELIRASGAVDSYEVDAGLCRTAQERFQGENNLRIHHQDFLQARLPEREPYKVFANIPFSITSGIIRKLTAAPNPPKEAWLVMEKGAAKRFMGKPADTIASLALKPFYDIQIVYHFSRQDFHPAPSVDTVLIHLARKPQEDLPFSLRGKYSWFLEKGLCYGLSALLTKKQIAAALRQAGLPEIPRSGLLLYVQWLCLFRCYCRISGRT